MSDVGVQVCQHHWLLGEPRQGIVPGVCKLCGLRREYPARLEDTDRFFDHEELLHQRRPLAPVYQASVEEQTN